MADSKTYLNVPYAQKDAAKALGARWDPANKKWYVPNGKDLALFAQWSVDNETTDVSSPTKPATRARIAVASTNSHSSTGVITHPSIKDFVAYSGDAPPWD